MISICESALKGSRKLVERRNDANRLSPKGGAHQVMESQGHHPDSHREKRGSPALKEDHELEHLERTRLWTVPEMAQLAAC